MPSAPSMHRITKGVLSDGSCTCAHTCQTSPPRRRNSDFRLLEPNGRNPFDILFRDAFLLPGARRCRLCFMSIRSGCAVRCTPLSAVKPGSLVSLRTARLISQSVGHDRAVVALLGLKRVAAGGSCWLSLTSRPSARMTPPEAAATSDRWAKSGGSQHRRRSETFGTVSLTRRLRSRTEVRRAKNLGTRPSRCFSRPFARAQSEAAPRRRTTASTHR